MVSVSCCNFCNDTRVIPERLRSVQGGLSIDFKNPDNIINMKNNLCYNTWNKKEINAENKE